ncbi:MotA/TolQ/ExbB proton channel family protein [Calditrichota bacterium GD2]
MEKQNPADPLSTKRKSALRSLSLTRSLLLGAGVTLVVLIGVYYLGQIKGFENIRALFLERGFIQYLITFLGAWSFSISFLKQREINWEKHKAAETKKHFHWTVSENVEEALKNIIKAVPGVERTRLFQRIQRAFSAFQSGMESNDLRDALLEQSDRDSENVELSYTILRVLVAVIPLLGFTGTVLGISNAVGNFSSVIETARELEQVTSHLGGVTTGLAVAFDTTLLSLLITVPLMMYTSALKKREDELLLEIDEFCEYEILDPIFQEKSKEKHLVDIIERLDQKVLEDHVAALAKTVNVLSDLNVNIQKHQTLFADSLQKYSEVSNALVQISKNQEFWADQIMSLEKVNNHLEAIFSSLKALPEGMKSVLLKTQESYYQGLISEMNKIIQTFEAKDSKTSEKLNAYLTYEEEMQKSLQQTMEKIHTGLAELKPILENLNKPVTITLSHQSTINK